MESLKKTYQFNPPAKLLYQIIKTRVTPYRTGREEQEKKLIATVMAAGSFALPMLENPSLRTNMSDMIGQDNGLVQVDKGQL